MKSIILFIILFFGQTGCQNIAGIFDDSNEQPLRVDGITLTVDESVYSVDDTVHVELHNLSEAPVFLPGCSQLNIATKVDTGWAESPLWVCVWEGFAVKIAPDSSYVLDQEAAHLSGTYRFVAHLSFGCKDGEPLSKAECERRDTIHSSNFVVSK